MRLTDCFMDVLAYVAYFLNSSMQSSYDKVRTDVQRMISDSERLSGDASISREDHDMARFAVCAWIDEAIIGSAWKDKGLWTREPLQRIYYQTSNAGELFFERLNRLGPHQQGVREIYYICLALGFMGRFCNKGDEFLLEQLKLSNLKLLTGSSMGLPAIDKGDLFPEAYPKGEVDIGKKKTRRGFPFHVFFGLGAPLLLLLVLFIIYKFVLSNIGENILGTVQ